MNRVSEPLVPLRHDSAICAVLCAKNAWLNDDVLKPLHVELNPPWHIVFAYAEKNKEAMNMALYVGMSDDPTDSPKSLIQIEHEHIEQLHITDAHFAERFATSCVVTMESGVYTVISGQPVTELTHEESRERFPRMDPPI